MYICSPVSYKKYLSLILIIIQQKDSQVGKSVLSATKDYVYHSIKGQKC